MEQSLGIHHITAIASDPAANVAFYVRFLGLRLVKRTVNFDDPTSYHLYYGDELGSPGTILTFFLWPGAPRGRVGSGLATAISFAVPRGALPFWRDRAEEFGHYVEEDTERLGDKALVLRDPDGLALHLVESKCLGPSRGAIPNWAAITGFFSVRLKVGNLGPTKELLMSLMQFQPENVDGDLYRFAAASHPGKYVDLLQSYDYSGEVGAGVIHHVAFRALDAVDQLRQRDELIRNGLAVSPVRDRTYFQSIYFREPAGILLEIATDPPGFTADEPAESLGRRLMLPEWLEPRRMEIEGALPPLPGYE